MSRPSRMSVVLSFSGVVLAFLSLFAAGVPVVPMVWYRLKPSVTTNLAVILRKPVAEAQDRPVAEVDTWQPPIDEALPVV